jgi:hypothetical protein
LILLKLALIILLTASLLGQSHNADHEMDNAIRLHPAAKTSIPTESNRPIYKPARCDAQGNVYFRGYQADDRRVPVVRADAKGQTAKYTLDSDASLANGTSYDFSVLPDGSLYQSVQVGQDVYIVAFDPEGKIKSKVRLEKQFWVARLNALRDKSFLAIGTEIQPLAEANSKQPPKLLIAIFDEHGRMVRPIVLDSISESNDTREKTAILATLSSDAQVGADGNLYLMVRTNPATVYVFDSGGQIKHSFKVRPPGPRMNAVSIGLAKQRLAILFRESFRGMQHNDVGIITIVDASTGAEVTRYSAGPDLGATLACYREDDFVFLGSDKDNLAIQHAGAK